MRCTNCGTELPQQVNFCWKCGKPQSKNPATEEARYEICEVEWVEKQRTRNNVAENLREGFGAIFGGYKPEGQFRAKVIGSKGIYFAKESPFFSTNIYVLEEGEEGSSITHVEPQRDNTAIQFLDNLIAHLVKDGWEPLETQGRNWYSYRFRRKTI
jgi:hypothetical protein